MDSEEEEEWRVVQENMRAIGERLLLARWASRVLDTEKGVSIELTSKGIAGMDNLFHALKELGPHTMRAEHAVGLLLFLTLRDARKKPPPGSQ